MQILGSFTSDAFWCFFSQIHSHVIWRSDTLFICMCRACVYMLGRLKSVLVCVMVTEGEKNQTPESSNLKFD